MEDNDKRNASVPPQEPQQEPHKDGTGVAPTDNAQSEGAPRNAGSARDSEMFDSHEATLPRFTIDPGEVGPSRQRTRTLLGVPTLVTQGGTPAAERDQNQSQSHEQAAAGAAPSGGSAGERPRPKLSTAVLELEVEAGDTHEALDITVELTDEADDTSEVTIVSDADVVALPDSTGRHAPVTVAQEPSPSSAAGPAAVSGAAGRAEVSVTQPAPGSSQSLPPASATPESLAPREVARRAAARPTRQDSSSRWGALLVAAVMLLATGAWFLTAGTFRRATLTELPAGPAANATAAVAQPVNNMAKPEPATLPPQLPEGVSHDRVAEAAPATPTPAHAEAESAEPGTGLRNKPSLTATVREERVRRPRSMRSRRSDKSSLAPEPSGGELPQGPSRAEVIARLQSVRPAVKACAAGRSGVADLDITIAHTGVVMHVLVGGDFAGTTEGSCIARAVRQAHFQSFKQERFRLLYPYAI